MNEDMNNAGADFEQLMENMRENFDMSDGAGVEISDERPKEMNKKLPDWDLEPPYSFLK